MHAYSGGHAWTLFRLSKEYNAYVPSGLRTTEDCYIDLSSHMDALDALGSANEWDLRGHIAGIADPGCRRVLRRQKKAWKGLVVSSIDSRQHLQDHGPSDELHEEQTHEDGTQNQEYQFDKTGPNEHGMAVSSSTADIEDEAMG